MNKKVVFFNLLYIILILSLIAFMIYVVGYLKDNRTECLKDPIAYFEEKNEGSTCNCYKGNAVYGENFDPENFNFDYTP